MFFEAQQIFKIMKLYIFCKWIQQQNQMGLLSALKSIIYKLDLLDSGSLLRIKGEPEHKTLLGGMISLSLMLLLAVAFWNRFVATFNKTIITSSTTISNADDPLSFQIQTMPAGPFMLGVQIFNHDLNGNIRYFDISLSQTIYRYGSPIDSIQYTLQPCRIDHWVGFPKIQKQFNEIGINNWACLPTNKSLEVKGKYSSLQSKTINILAKKCTNSSDSRPCANQSQVDKLFDQNGGSLFFSIYFVNPIINSQNQKYIDYYLEDANYIIFSRNGGEESRLFIEDFQITTDQSIFPMQDSMSERGGRISNNILKSTFTNITDVYAAFYLFKSSTSSIYNRSFQKLDDVFSYIGGLFGTILILFFLISAYNTYKFQINIAGYLYYKQQRTASAQKNYNFVYYIGQLIYTALKSLNCSPKWKQLNYYYKTREEVLKQLDVLLIMKRLNLLQKSLSYLFSDHQLKGLYMANHFTFQQAVSLRRRYKLKAKLKEQIQSLVKSNLAYQREQNVTDSFANNELLKVNANLNKAVQDSFINEQLITNQFDSDRYSSQSSSQDEDNIKVLSALKLLRSEHSENRVSNSIWRDLDKRVHAMVEPMLLKEATLKEDNDQQLIINNYNSKDKVNIQLPPNLPLYSQLSPRERIQDEERDHADKNIQNITIAQLMFSKIQTIHPESRSQRDDKQK